MYLRIVSERYNSRATEFGKRLQKVAEEKVGSSVTGMAQIVGDGKGGGLHLRPLLLYQNLHKL